MRLPLTCDIHGLRIQSGLKTLWVGSYQYLQSTIGKYAAVIPWPVRYERAKTYTELEAVITAQFSTGPGQEMVFAGEYELFDNDTVLSQDDFKNAPLLPGMSITMAIVVGQYGELARCPRPGCKSLSFVASPK